MAKDTDLAPDVMTQVNLTVIIFIKGIIIYYHKQVYPTQTVYVFQESGIQLTLTVSVIKCSLMILIILHQFSTPAFAATDKIPTLPVTFLTYTVEAIDGLSNHTVKIYYDNTAEVIK